MADGAARAVLVVGIGNELRGDDGAGIAAVRTLRDEGAPAGVAVREEQGEPIGLIDAWHGSDAVVLVDTMRSGAAPGAIRRLDATDRALPAAITGSTSTHAVTIGEAIELARALERLPRHVVVLAVEGRRFDAGRELSAEVRAAIPALVAALRAELEGLAAGPRGGGS